VNLVWYFWHIFISYVVGQSSRTRQRLLAMTALYKSLSIFDDVNIHILAFHSCVVVVVVDLRQSLSEWHLLMSACV
jgi:hypothetical protein